MVVALIIVTQLKNKTKWYISILSTQISSQYCIALLNLQISNNEPNNMYVYHLYKRYEINKWRQVSSYYLDS